MENDLLLQLGSEMHLILTVETFGYAARISSTIEAITEIDIAEMQILQH